MRALILWVVLIAGAVWWAPSEPSEQAYDAINRKVYELAALADQLYGLPRERLPSIRVYQIEEYDATAQCSNWTISLDVRVVNADLPFVLNTLLPHEYAHLVECWRGNGTMSIPVHGPSWSKTSVALGGPATDHRRRTS